MAEDDDAVINTLWALCGYDDALIGRVAAKNPSRLQLRMLRTLSSIHAFLGDDGQPPPKNDISLLYERAAPLVPSFEVHGVDAPGVFLAVCRLGNAETVHEASSKQLAKRGAARAMLDLLGL